MHLQRRNLQDCGVPWYLRYIVQVEKHASDCSTETLAFFGATRHCPYVQQSYKYGKYMSIHGGAKTWSRLHPEMSTCFNSTYLFTNTPGHWMSLLHTSLAAADGGGDGVAR